jgi:hypothetical protein
MDSLSDHDCCGCFLRLSASIHCLICYSFGSRSHAYAKDGGRESPGRRVTFFRVAERKSPKKGRPCCLRPLRCATGQPGVLGHGVHRRTRCAPAALRSDNCGESDHEACALRRACHPAPCAPQAHTEGNPPGSDIHSGHRCARPRLSGASAARCASTAERSKGPCGCLDVRLLDVRLSTPCWLRLRRGGCGVARASERACFVL